MSEGADGVAATQHVMIVASGEAARSIQNALWDAGSAGSVDLYADLPAAVGHLATMTCDVIVLGVADATALGAIDLLHRCAPDVALVVVTGDDPAEALRAQALARGAQDCFALRELRPDLLRHVLRHAISRACLERERRTHEAELHALFDLNPHPMWVLDTLTLRFLAVNRAAIHAYGYSEQEFLAMSLADIRSSEEAKRLRGHVEAGWPESASAAIGRHRRRDGSEIEVEVRTQAAPFRGRAARLVQARDVTAERRAMRALETSERRFRDLFEHSTGYICIHDLDGILLAVNPAAAAALGRGVAELLGLPLRDFIAPERRFQFDDYLQRMRRHGEDAGFMRVQGRSGTDMLWQYRNRIYRDADGSSCATCYAQDITALRAAERALERSEHRLRTIADTLPLQIAYLDPEQRLVFANEAYRSGHARSADIAGVPLRDVLGEARHARYLPFLERALAGERVVFEDAEGEGEDYRCDEITLIPEIAGSAAQVVGVHAMAQDVTSKKREERRLIHLARVDNLSGVLNRAGFYERLDNAIARARDQGTLLALFYLDIDRFKQVNDRHGHAAGDALIRAFAVRLADKLRASDVVARLGGDEFTVVMEGVPDAAHVEAIATELVAAMQQPFELHGEGVVLSVGASIGIALCRAGLVPAAQLVACADAMLYKAKQAGRATWRLATVTDPAEFQP